MKAPVEEHFFSKPKTKKSFPIICVLIPGFCAAGAFAATSLVYDRIVQTGKAE